MLFFGGNGDLWAHAILCNQLMKMHSRLTGSNRQHFIPFPGNVGLQPLRHWTMGRFVQSWRESASAAAAANNLEKTSGFQRYSPERRQLQPLRHWPWAVSAFWCPARRHFDASFGRKHVASPLPLHAFWKPDSDYLLLCYFQYRCSMPNM